MLQTYIAQLAIVTVLFLLPRNEVNAISAADAFSLAEKSVVLLRVEGFTKENKHFQNFGSGFIVDDQGHVVTAKHMIPSDADFHAFEIKCSMASLH